MALKRRNNPIVQDVVVEEAPAAESTKLCVEMRLAANASMYINTGNSQNQGARPYQEDSFGYSNIIDSDIVSNKGVLVVLSDGMGGLANGKSVADYVVQASISMFDSLNPQGNIRQQLESIVHYINNAICTQYAADDSLSRAGATMVAAYIFKNRIYWITVGDSRLYCLRNGALLQMNEDHDYKNQLYREYINDGGSIADIEADEQKDSLVCFIGKKEIPYVDASIRGYKIKPGDTFVLCSDGIYNAITEAAMKEILASDDAQTASDKIVSTIVNSRLPGQDNMTVMVIKCEKNM